MFFSVVEPLRGGGGGLKLPEPLFSIIKKIDQNLIKYKKMYKQREMWLLKGMCIFCTDPSCINWFILTVYWISCAT